MSAVAELVAAVDRLTERIARLERAAKKPPRRAWRPREVAAMTGIGYERVLELIHSGELGHIKEGRLHVVPDAEVQRYLAAAQTNQTEK
ncbi:excisionase family DNA-binding protein [Amycolatopsis thermoflava]|uniref:excisionase family DNA-binding protein n=1 Tax=Amycolatopsis thermoflava TaxID=84480 RepID=UPI003F49C60E